MCVSHSTVMLTGGMPLQSAVGAQHELAARVQGLTLIPGPHIIRLSNNGQADRIVDFGSNAVRKRSGRCGRAFRQQRIGHDGLLQEGVRTERFSACCGGAALLCDELQRTWIYKQQYQPEFFSDWVRAITHNRRCSTSDLSQQKVAGPL